MRNLWMGIAFTLTCVPNSRILAQVDTTATPRIERVIKKEAAKATGFFSVYTQNGRYYLEIPQKMLGRDILSSITILRGAARQERTTEMRFGYGGDSVFDKLIRFVKKDDKINLIAPPVYYHQDSTSLYHDYFTNLEGDIIASFPVQAKGTDSYLIDITNMMTSDTDIFSLRGATTTLKLGAYLPEQTEILTTRAFPNNINFTSYRSYMLAEPAKGELPVSRWEVAASWYLLPEKPMQPRLADSRVGYFNYSLEGMDTHTMERLPIAARWRLEPRPEDVEKYKKGELVEPQKPIVFYIDRGTPEFLRPYFIKAVNNWAPVFEKAGFKNAIHAEMAPEDSTYSEGDTRFPLVSYKASPIPNAYGPSIIDPRSGEILSSHVAVFSSILNLLQRWYFVMCGNVDPRARQYPLSHEVVGRLAETVVTHEVGHTLGLRHDFMGSTVYPTDSLRNADFIRKNGLGASIMDYQRFNYVAQPEDHLQPDELLPRIGAYDQFAIEWGYRYFPGKTTDQINDTLHTWVDDKRKDHRNLYIVESEAGDPRVQSEDSGNDIIKANRLGLRNLKQIMQHLEAWTPENDKTYFVLRKRYLSVLNQYWNYIRHITRILGGHYSDKPAREEKLIIYQRVPEHIQEEALQFLKDNFLTQQDWLFSPKLMAKTGLDPDIYIKGEYKNELSGILVKYTIMNDKEYPRLFSYLYTNIYEKNTSRPLTAYERMLQTSMLEVMVANAESPANITNGVGLVLKELIEKIRTLAKTGSKTCPDYLTSAHYHTLYNFITLWENEKNNSLLTQNR